MSERDVRPLLPGSFRTENPLSQQAEFTRIPDAIEQYSVALERLRTAKVQGDLLEPRLREPNLKLQLGQVVQFIFPAQGDMSWNEKALHWVENAPQLFEFDRQAVGNEHAQLPA